MGNYISCSLATQGDKYCRAIKVIFPNGEIKQFKIPIKAAELMLEIPNFFLVNTKSLQIGTRFSALNADEDLEMGNAYVLFPMKRLNSFVTAADMGALLITTNSTVKRITGRSTAKILPDVNVDKNIKKIEIKLLNDLDDIAEEYSSTLEYRRKMSFCGSKKPLLETIAEEPICSR